MADTALDGVKVLEYASLVSGPYAGKILADYGAEVIKIEKPEVGDEARRRGPFPGDDPHPDKSGLFLYLNANKMGITLEPKNPLGKKIFERLVKWADILIEDKPPREMRQHGLSWDSLKKVNPKLIMVSITPFGYNGSYEDYKAYNLNISHLNGASFGLAAGAAKPVKTAGLAASYDGGVFGATGALAGLVARDVTGKGQHVDVSMQDAEICLFATVIANELNNERMMVNMGNQVIPAADGHVLFLSLEERQWQGMVQAMGTPEWTQLDKFKDPVKRFAAAAEMQQHISEWTKEHPKAELMELAVKYHFPAAPVNSPKDLIESEHLKARKFFQEIDHPVAGKWKYPTTNYIFSETPWSCRRPAPLLGQDNEAVYCDRLGYTREELVWMRANNII